MLDIAPKEVKPTRPSTGEVTKKGSRAVAAGAWATSGVSIAKPRPPAKCLNDRFKNPLVKVDIVTGEVLVFRLSGSAL